MKISPDGSPPLLLPLLPPHPLPQALIRPQLEAMREPPGPPDYFGHPVYFPARVPFTWPSNCMLLAGGEAGSMANFSSGNDTLANVYLLVFCLRFEMCPDLAFGCCFRPTHMHTYARTYTHIHVQYARTRRMRTYAHTRHSGIYAHIQAWHAHIHTHIHTGTANPVQAEDALQLVTVGVRMDLGKGLCMS